MNYNSCTSIFLIVVIMAQNYNENMATCLFYVYSRTIIISEVVSFLAEKGSISTSGKTLVYSFISLMVVVVVVVVVVIIAIVVP